MQTLEYHTMDKSDWEPGPWQQEPDKKQWTDEATGLPCLIVRNRIGALCGYVGVPEGHRYYGEDYEKPDVEVHGGLTFSDFCQPTEDESKGICHKPDHGEPEKVWWLGFDCAHCGDYYDLNSPLRHKYPKSPDDRYRDFAYVESECRSLAKQIAAGC